MPGERESNIILENSFTGRETKRSYQLRNRCIIVNHTIKNSVKKK